MATVSTGLATSFITFSRPGASGGGATVTDRDGKIKWAGHNLLTNSESFDASAWIKGRALVSANAVAAPNGATTADSITQQTGETTGGFVVQNFTSQDASYAVSFCAKANGKNFITVFEALQSASSVYTWINVSTGTVGTTGSGHTVTPPVALGGGWYFCTVKFTATARVGNVGISLADTNGSFTVVDSGGVHLWGAHLYRSDLGGMQQNPAMPAGMQSYYPTTPRNLMEYTEDIENGTWGGRTRVTIAKSGVVAPNGFGYGYKVNPTGNSANDSYFYQSRTLVAGTPYTFSIYMKDAGLGWGSIFIEGGSAAQAFFNLAAGTKGSITGSASGKSSEIVPVGDGWYRCSLTSTATTSGSRVVGIAMAEGDGDLTFAAGTSNGIYLWGAQLSDSASLDTYVPQYGAAVTSAAYYAPRLDYDGATLSPKGLLVEEQRVNNLKHSQAFDDATWVKDRCTVTANAFASPDGTQSADKIVEDNTASNTHEVTYNGGWTFAINTTYTFSVYLRSAERTRALIRFATTASNNPAVIVNLATGVIAETQGTVTAFTTDAGGGWRRLVMTWTTPGTINSNGFFIGPTSDTTSFSTTTGYNGDNTSGIYVYGAQLEAGSFATSYIPNGSAVAGATRTADVASVSTQAFPYSASEGTIVANGTFFGLNKGASDGLVALTNGSSAENIALFRTGSGNNIKFAMRDNSSDQADYTVAMGSQPVKAAFAYAENNSNAALNGTAQTTDTTCTLPTVNEMLIGSIYTKGDYPTNGWIRQITYIPRRLTNAELQSRTA